MRRAVEARLRKLERAGRNESRRVTVCVRDEAEHDRQVAELKASGQVTDDDLIICIMRFGEGEVPAPTIDGALAEVLREINARGRPRPGEGSRADPSPAYIFGEPR